MDAIRNVLCEMLARGEVKAVLGFEAGTGGRLRPMLARRAEELERLVLDPAAGFNLAGLLCKPEVRALFPLALVGGPATLRSLLQLHAERQLVDGQVLAMPTGDPLVIASAAELETHLALQAAGIPAADRARLDELQALGAAGRWDWWQQEFSRCTKCYACRQACPMCYCGHCTMDGNRPQWVPVASHALGNLEYHAVRAMHLAGRCVQCGSCGEACPVGIPVHLLSMHGEERSAALFGQRAGQHARLDYALATFRPDDKETFIR